MKADPASMLPILVQAQRRTIDSSPDPCRLKLGYYCHLRFAWQ